MTEVFDNRGYLLDLTRRVPLKRTFEELVDILARYRYTEFRLYYEGLFPEELLDYNRLQAYCQMQEVELIRTSKDEYEQLFLSGKYICVDTESRQSLAGRVEEMRERMINAETMGRGRNGFLVTDFSDEFSWQPLAVSLPAIVMGGNFASGGAKAAKMDLEHELDLVMNAPLGGILLRLGTLYLRGGARKDDASEYFNILSHDHGYSRHPGITQFVLDDVAGIAHGVRIVAERWSERNDWAKEIVYMANLLDCACHRRDESRLRELRDEHGRIWRMRFAPDGRVDSLSKLPRF